MTPTETLRAMLDERGVEWKAPASYDGSTKYDTIVDGYWFHEYNGKITVHGLTPEQAIAITLGHSSNCTNSERTNAACKPITYDNGYSTDHLDPGEYYEFWEPACACGNCGELIPMRKFCPNCGCRLEVDG